ncbi:hypothetical protein EXN66_Car015097 [Channa argus]|uniref:Uncharacterized protein n=1 Tax=Channa argus TaxID=215402 RepID=A0A6G1Q9T6_CHAAH|nr:hypothetical protein EXN66_Car015097 [Channa argus]
MELNRGEEDTMDDKALILRDTVAYYPNLDLCPPTALVLLIYNASNKEPNIPFTPSYSAVPAFQRIQCPATTVHSESGMKAGCKEYYKLLRSQMDLSKVLKKQEDFSESSKKAAINRSDNNSQFQDNCGITETPTKTPEMTQNNKSPNLNCNRNNKTCAMHTRIPAINDIRPFSCRLKPRTHTQQAKSKPDVSPFQNSVALTQLVCSRFGTTRPVMDRKASLKAAHAPVHRLAYCLGPLGHPNSRRQRFRGSSNDPRRKRKVGEESVRPAALMMRCRPESIRLCVFTSESEFKNGLKSSNPSTVMVDGFELGDPHCYRVVSITAVQQSDKPLFHIVALGAEGQPLFTSTSQLIRALYQPEGKEMRVRARHSSALQLGKPAGCQQTSIYKNVLMKCRVTGRSGINLRVDFVGPDSTGNGAYE